MNIFCFVLANKRESYRDAEVMIKKWQIYTRDRKIDVYDKGGFQLQLSLNPSHHLALYSFKIKNARRLMTQPLREACLSPSPWN
jgi:hypothetical protein